MWLHALTLSIVAAVLSTATAVNYFALDSLSTLPTTFETLEDLRQLIRGPHPHRWRLAKSVYDLGMTSWEEVQQPQNRWLGWFSNDLKQFLAEYTDRHTAKLRETGTTPTLVAFCNANGFGDVVLSLSHAFWAALESDRLYFIHCDELKQLTDEFEPRRLGTQSDLDWNSYDRVEQQLGKASKVPLMTKDKLVDPPPLPYDESQRSKACPRALPIGKSSYMDHCYRVYDKNETVVGWIGTHWKCHDCLYAAMPEARRCTVPEFQDPFCIERRLLTASLDEFPVENRAIARQLNADHLLIGDRSCFIYHNVLFKPTPALVGVVAKLAYRIGLEPLSGEEYLISMHIRLPDQYRGNGKDSTAVEAVKKSVDGALKLQQRLEDAYGVRKRVVWFVATNEPSVRSLVAKHVPRNSTISVLHPKTSRVVHLKHANSLEKMSKVEDDDGSQSAKENLDSPLARIAMAHEEAMAAVSPGVLLKLKLLSEYVIMSASHAIVAHGSMNYGSYFSLIAGCSGGLPPEFFLDVRQKSSRRSQKKRGLLDDIDG